MKNIIPKALEQLIGALEEIEEQYKVKYYLVGGILANIEAIKLITKIKL